MRRLSLAVAALLALGTPVAAVPGAANQAMERARAALQRGDGIAAEVEIERAMAKGASRSEVAAAMGEAKLIQGDLVGARQWLDDGKFSPSDAAYGWRMLGLLERREGHLPEAGKAYDRALAITPNDPQLWVDIGRLRYVGGEHLSAIDAAARALAAGPDYPRALEFGAEIARDAAGWNPAIELYSRALAAAPNNLDLMAGYAATLGEAGRGHDMLSLTRRMLTRAPRDSRPWLYQAVLAARAGNIELARSMVGRASVQIQAKPAGLLLSGVLELEAGNANVAVGLLERLVSMQPANQRASLLLARAYYEADQNQALLARFAPLARRADAPAYLLTLVGRAYEEEGDRLAAAPLLDRAARAEPVPLAAVIGPGAMPGADPSDPAAMLVRARSLLGDGDLDGAEAVAVRMLDARPKSANALAAMGDVDLVRSRPDAAIERYLLAARVRFSENLLVRLDAAYRQAGRAGKGREQSLRYLIAYPQSLLAARIVADNAAQEHDWALASLLLASLRDRGGERDVRLLADLAFAQLRAGDPQAASDSAARAFSLQPMSAQAAQAWAMALAETGADKPLARQLVDLARTLGGDNLLLAQTRRKLDQP